MATCPTDTASYAEEIRTFTFRGIDGITIPKEVREQAYTLAVDIIIRSIARETYKNYECMPSESYYGVATIVSQDALELKIPVKFPRQRIYYGRVPEAFEQWNALVNFEYQRAYFLAVGESLQSLGTALGAGSIPAVFCCSLPAPKWIELPLREVYFHPPIGTQYEIEVSWIRPVSFSDSCDTFFDGTSQYMDGDKDAGLPPNGIFPNVADDPEDPYAGLPDETPDSEQLGFSNSKSANLDDEDPQNQPEYPSDAGVTIIRYGVRNYPVNGGTDFGMQEYIITPSFRGCSYAFDPSQNGTPQTLYLQDVSGLTTYREFWTNGSEIYNISFEFVPD
jgi:hypothetical protein